MELFLKWKYFGAIYGNNSMLTNMAVNFKLPSLIKSKKKQNLIMDFLVFVGTMLLLREN